MTTYTDHINRVTEISNLTGMNVRHQELIEAVAWALDSEDECAAIMDANPRYADYCRRNYRIAVEDRKLALTELGEWEHATGRKSRFSKLAQNYI